MASSCVTIAIKAAVRRRRDRVEIAGSDSDEIARKRLLMLANKYNRSMLEPRLLFPHAYDKLYLVS